MPIFSIRRKPSFSRMKRGLSSSTDPLDFLQAGRSAGSGGGKDAFNQILGSFHDALADVDRAIQSIIERLRHERNISDRMAVQANGDVRAEMARAITLADAKRNELTSEISFRLQAMFLQNLIISPDQEPPVRRWLSLYDHVIPRDLPAVSEPALSEPDGSLNVRRGRLRRWQRESDEWLAVLCLHSAGEVVAKLVDHIGDYSSAWTETVNRVRRESMAGGRLSSELTDPENWIFDDNDPTVKNVVSGTEAQQTAARILNRFQLSDADLSGICEAVHETLEGRPIYGAGRIDALELEDILISAVADRLKGAMSLDDGFIPLTSNGSGRVGDELGQLMVEMRMGAAAMEERLWRAADYRMGHVDSAAWVGITNSSLRDAALSALGRSRRFAAVERHPNDMHRIKIQMSTVGASISDLAIFTEMVDAWYSWHFDERGGEAVGKDSWKLYPDIGRNSGVHFAVIELIDDDLRQVWNTSGDVALRLAHGRFDDSDVGVAESVSKSQPQLPG